jgi:excisionase family DNA binding protein
MTTSLSDDVRHLSWAAAQLGIGTSTAYRLVAVGKIPGAFRIGAQWRVSVPRFLAEVHGQLADRDPRSDLRSTAQLGSARVLPRAAARSRSRPSRTCE